MTDLKWSTTSPTTNGPRVQKRERATKARDTHRTAFHLIVVVMGAAATTAAHRQGNINYFWLSEKPMITVTMMIHLLVFQLYSLLWIEWEIGAQAVTSNCCECIVVDACVCLCTFCLAAFLYSSFGADLMRAYWQPICQEPSTRFPTPKFNCFKRFCRINILLGN